MEVRIWEVLGYEARILMNGISDLIKEAPERSLSMLYVRTLKIIIIIIIYEPRSRLSPDTKSANTLILDFSTSRIVGNKSPLFISHLVYNFGRAALME